MPVRGDRQVRPGVNSTSSGPNVRCVPSGARSVAAGPVLAAVLAPDPERHQGAAVGEIDAEPVPAAASVSRGAVDHSWSSHAVPVTRSARPPRRTVPLTRSCGTL
jgi:hypothetical protein